MMKGRSVDWWLNVHGQSFKRLSVTQAAGYAGDTLVAIALAGTIFFDVPPAEARGKVAIYLLLTAAPFIVLSPLLPRVFARLPNPYRVGLVGSGGIRAIIGIALLLVGLDSIWLFPLVFGLLVFGRLHGIARSSLLPLTLPREAVLVAANSHQAQIGLMAGAVAALIGAALMQGFGPEAPLLLSVGTFLATAVLASTIDTPSTAQDSATEPSAGWSPHTVTRLSLAAAAIVRSLHGFLVLLVAFAFKEADAGLLDFGALLGAAGAGYGLASFLVPRLERRLREEPLVIGALGIQAVAALIDDQFFGLAAGVIAITSAGLAWGTAKFAFDGILQHRTEPHMRGLAFTRSETLFQVAWVMGAIVPAAISIDVSSGLVFTAAAALFALVIIGTPLLTSIRQGR